MFKLGGIYGKLFLVKQSAQDSQNKLFAIAESQGGYFTAKQAEEAGFDRSNYPYHLRAGNWQREYRGIFRLSHFPIGEHPDLVRWSLWSRNRQDQVQGVYSHQTALSLYDLSDVMPSKFHLTVPLAFRRGAAIPQALILHYADLLPQDVIEREGYRVTSPLRTLLDVCAAQEISSDLLIQAFTQARKAGLITENEIKAHRQHFPAYLFSSR